MDYLPEDTYLEMPADTLEVVRRDINMDKPGEMKEAVRILDEWVHQQPHFIKKDIPLHYLEMTIVAAKGSIERAKGIIEKMLLARTVMSHHFKPHDCKEDCEMFKDYLHIIALPKLSPEYYRIAVVKIHGKFSKEMFEGVYKYVYASVDYLKTHDYHCGVVVIVDATDCDLKHYVTNMNIFDLKKFFYTLLEGYGMRLKKYHLITTSKLIHTAISFFKPFFSKKIMDRVVVNESIEELLSYYPKNILPKDYGGDEKSFIELQDLITRRLSSEKYIQDMETMYEAKIDQSLRPLSDIDEEIGISDNVTLCKADRIILLKLDKQHRRVLQSAIETTRKIPSK